MVGSVDFAVIDGMDHVIMKLVGYMQRAQSADITRKDRLYMHKPH